MKVIRYTQSWFEVDSTGSSRAKFEAGKCYPISEETTRHVDRGIAEVVDAPEDAEKAEAVAEKAEAKADEAKTKADEARAAATAAVDAQAIADAAAPQAETPAA